MAIDWDPFFGPPIVRAEGTLRRWHDRLDPSDVVVAATSSEERRLLDPYTVEMDELTQQNENDAHRSTRLEQQTQVRLREFQRANQPFSDGAASPPLSDQTVDHSSAETAPCRSNPSAAVSGPPKADVLDDEELDAIIASRSSLKREESTVTSQAPAQPLRDPLENSDDELLGPQGHRQAKQLDTLDYI